jgi:trimeric autotransporter adhesin
MTMVQSSAFTNDQLSAMSNDQFYAMQSTSPIVLDLDFDGVRTVAASHGVNFDITATGRTSQVGWASPTDGLLVMDRNHDGLINDGSELFGSATRLASGERAGDGFRALAELDADRDGRITSADAHWKDLQLWIDANQNGVTDAGELKSLDEQGISSLNLQAERGTAMDNGNLMGLVSSYETRDGQQHEMVDVWFSKHRVETSDVLAEPAPDAVSAAALSALNQPDSSSQAGGVVPHADLSQSTALAQSPDATLVSTTLRQVDEQQNQGTPLI